MIKSHIHETYTTKVVPQLMGTKRKKKTSQKVKRIKINVTNNNEP